MPIARSIVAAVLALLVGSASAAVESREVISGIATRDGSFGMYLAFDLSDGAEPRQPRNIQLMVSENYLSRFAGKTGKSAKLAEVKNCKHSPKAFKQFHEGAFGSYGKNDFTDILPVALECGDLSFVFLLYRNEAMTKKTLDGFEKRSGKRFDWRTRKIAAVWWASSRDMIPLEDLSKIKDPTAVLAAKLK